MSIEVVMDYEFMKISDVCAFTTLSRSSVYREIKKGNLPKPIKITAGRVAWKRSEVLSSPLIQSLYV